LQATSLLFGWTIHGIPLAPERPQPTLMEFFRTENGRVVEVWGAGSGLPDSCQVMHTLLPFANFLNWKKSTPSLHLSQFRRKERGIDANRAYLKEKNNLVNHSACRTGDMANRQSMDLERTPGAGHQLHPDPVRTTTEFALANVPSV